MSQLFEPQFQMGEKVRFIGCSEGQRRWGAPYADDTLLVEGEVYWLSKVDEHTQHTQVWLGEGDFGPFNSVCFERVEALGETSE